MHVKRDKSYNRDESCHEKFFLTICDRLNELYTVIEAVIRALLNQSSRL